MARKPPSGKVTFLFYDGVGSSKVALEAPYEQYRKEFLQKLYDETESLVRQHNGVTSGTSHGDDWLAVFEKATDAIACAVALQRQVTEIVLTVGEKTWRMPIRLALHTAEQEAFPDKAGSFQNHPEVIFGARVLPLANAGQILLTESVKTAAGNLEYACKEFRNRRIRNFDDRPRSLFELLYDGVERGEPGVRYLPEWFTETNRYVTRTTLENAIADLFGEKTSNGQPVRLVTLHGFGGMGKTRLAVQCALNSVALFEGRLYSARLGDIPSDGLLTDDTLRRDYLYGRLLDAFQITQTPLPTPEELPATLQHLLAKLKHPGDTLLLLDNWETVSGKASRDLIAKVLRACPELRILATGREAVGIQNTERKRLIDSLEAQEAESLLRLRISEAKETAWTPSPTDEAAISQLLALTEGIPLAIELVAAHATDMTLKQIAADLTAEPLSPVTELPEGTGTLDTETDRHQSLERCLNWSWKLLPSEAQTALACLSLFADRCPPEEIGFCFDFVLPDHLRRLTRAALTRWDDQTDTYSLLRPTRAYANRQLLARDPDATLRRRFVAFYRNIAKENGGGSKVEIKTKRDRLEAAWPHAQNAVELASELNDGESCGEIVNWFHHFVQRQIRWTEAIPLFLKALAAQRTSLGEKHPEVATSLNNLALLYDSQGRYTEAEPLYNEALKICRASLPDGHPLIANSLGNLAELYRTQGRFAEAEPLHNESLQIRRTSLPEGHPSIASSLNNLALLYYDQGRYAEAEPLYHEALQIRRASLPKGHPDIANSLGNLAGFYHSQGRFAEAKPLYDEALKILCTSLPEGHPSIAQILNNLAGLYESQGQFAEAESLYRQAVQILLAALGANHPKTQGVIANHLIMLHKAGKLAEVLPSMFPLYLSVLRRLMGQG